MTRLRTFLLLVLVSVLVTASIQWSENITEQTTQVAVSAERDEVDYSIEDFDLSLLDAEGKMQYHLYASSMLHYKQSDQTHLEKPNVALSHGTNEQWKIQASKGLVSPRGDDVNLQGHVRIERIASANSSPLSMTMDKLLISTKNNTISTQDEVQLLGDGIRLQATGLYADLNEEKIQLLAKVKVRYVPPP